MGKNYDFDGWPSGETPVDLFDQARWTECLHAAIQAFNVIGSAGLLLMAVTDTGILHELSHLACGVPICTHVPNLAYLRSEVVELTDLVSAQLGGRDDG